MKKAIDLISSPALLVSLLLPLVLWLCAAIYVIGMPPAAAARTVAAKSFLTACMATAAVSAAYLIRARSYGNGIIRIGIGLVFLQGLFLYGFSFSGKTGIGAGETARDFYEVEAGAFAKAPALPVTFLEVKPGPPRTAAVSIAGTEQVLAQGNTAFWGGYRLRLTAITRAPLFILQNKKGTELDAGYIKLDFQEPGRQYFQFAALPHTFYISVPGSEEESWKFAGSAWEREPAKRVQTGDTDDPPVLHMTITRGKLVIQNRDVKRGEPVSFDGYTVHFERSAPWIEMEVSKKHSFLLLYLGLALVLVGGFLHVVMRRP